MTKEKILITVKTYPTLSSKYDEVVCTAGFREDGSWVRIYPIPFRKLEDIDKYKKYDWVEVDLERNMSDVRHESYRLRSGIKTLRNVDTRQNWFERKQTIISKGKVFTNFDEIIDQNKNNHALSLATFKPSEIVGFKITEEKNREWDQKKLAAVELKATQKDIFKNDIKLFKVVNKLPYKFQYTFKDDTGKERTLTIGDWEIGALYWKMLRDSEGNENEALQKVREQFYDNFITKDIHFFVGTTLSWDLQNAPNPFMIIGVFYPPQNIQSGFANF